MPHITYVPKRFTPEHQQIIRRAVEIATTFQAQGYDLTLRQVYYQFVARGWLANTMQSYKRLGSIINDARLAGELDWDMITDRTRYLRSTTFWRDPAHIIEAAVEGFRRNLWVTTEQRYRPEVWVEKDALVGVIGRTCDELAVPYLSCRGYVSQSEMWESGRRMRRHLQQGLVPVVLHLGDHDPSGLDMTRDIRDRLSMFAGRPVQVQRVALNMDQVEQYGPPPNPAKLTDSRGSTYVDEYGDDSWELDALTPEVLDGLVREALDPLIDTEAWAEGEDADEADRARMRTVASRWVELDARWDDVEAVLDE